MQTCSWHDVWREDSAKEGDRANEERKEAVTSVCLASGAKHAHDDLEYSTLWMIHLRPLSGTCLPEMHVLSAPDGQGPFQKASNSISGFDLPT